MTEKSNFNKTHPELQEGEVFLVNGFIPKNANLLRDFQAIGWETKREGEVAYDPSGKTLPDHRPIFVQRTELEQEGLNPDAI